MIDTDRVGVGREHAGQVRARWASGEVLSGRVGTYGGKRGQLSGQSDSAVGAVGAGQGWWLLRVAEVRAGTESAAVSVQGSVESEVTDAEGVGPLPHLENIVTIATTDTETALAEAWVYLARVAAGPNATLHALAAEHGPQYVAAMIESGLVPDEHANALAAVIERASRLDIAAQNVAAAGVSARTITRADSEWPASFAELGDREPFGLWVRGKAELLNSGPVLIEGSRASTPSGDHVSGSFAADLVKKGVAICAPSGLGLVVAAVRAALAEGGDVVVLLASGIDWPHPMGEARTLAQVAEQGLLVSEYAPGTVATRLHVDERQRLAVALSSRVFIVEAGIQCRSLRAARLAARLGRPVLAAPGPVVSACSRGSNGLISKGAARCVTSAEEILETPDGE